MKRTYISVKRKWNICKYMLCHNRGYDINVARVINLKLAFRDWFFYDLILVKLCEIRYLNLCKALLFPRNQVICLKDWKLWRTPTTIKTNIFCWNFAHVSYFLLTRFPHVYQRVCGIFFILFKDAKNQCVETRSFNFCK